VNTIRVAIVQWESAVDHVSGPRPDGQLGAIIEVMLGASARIGEVLAIRRCDVDVTSAVPSIRIAGTIVSRRGELTFRQDHPKTSRSTRVAALQTFTSDAVRRRLAAGEVLAPDDLLFQSRDGTPLTTANVRRHLRRVLGGAGIDGVTPHLFRRTVATAVNTFANVDLAAELLGHTDTKITVMHYIRRSEQVNPATAALLDQVFAGDADRPGST
jgi:integrase